MNIRLSGKNVNTRGFSLLEALISMVVMLIVLGGAVAVFVQNQRASAANVSLTLLRTNLRAAVQTMASDIRQIGAISRNTYVTAMSSYNLPIIQCTNINPEVMESGYNLQQYTGYDPAQSDRIRIIDPDLSKNTRLVEDMNNDTTSTAKTVKILNNELEEGDIVVITNSNLVEDPSAAFADLLEITTVQPDSSDNRFTEITFNPSGLNVKPLNMPYPAGSALVRVRIWEYYIDRTDPQIPKLYRLEARTNSHPELVAEFVEDFQVALGIDTNGNENVEDSEWVDTNFQNYFTAPGSNQLANLRAVRITLIGRTGRVPVEMAGQRQNTQDINYRMPAMEDYTGSRYETSYPQFREAYTEVIFLRNMRPEPTTP